MVTVTQNKGQPTLNYLVEKAMKETRREKRATPRELEPVEVQIMGEGEGFLDILHAKDVGSHGLGIYVPHGFRDTNIHDEVRLIVSIPPSTSFNAKGVIRHSGLVAEDNDSRRFFGIFFTEIHTEHQRLLQNYVESRLADKRQHLRVPPRPGEPITALAAKGERTEEVSVSDISIGGMCIQDSQLLALCDTEEEIRFSLSFPFGETLSVSGGLAHQGRENSNFGICFKDLTEEQQQVLERYVVLRANDLQKLF